MSRRARGEGTVTRDGDGWIARIELPPGPDGRRRRPKRRAATEKEAYKKLQELQRERDDALNPGRRSRTVGDAVAAFLAIPTAVERAEHTIYLDRWRGEMITAGLGRRRLGELTVQECDQFLQAVADGRFGDRPMNTDGVRRTRRLLIKILANEMRINNLARNVADLSVMPVCHDRSVTTSNVHDVDESEDDELLDGDRRSLTPDELARLRAIASHQLLVVVELCGRNGLRPAEARGLRWSCVDLDDLTLTVNRQMSSKDRLTKTKTKRARRTITIDQETAECLTKWSERQADQANRAGPLWANTAGLIVTTRVGTAINRNNLNRSMTRLSRKARLTPPIVPYELRHTAITFQVEAGHENWRIADWAGTSERMIEEVYRHKLNRVTELAPVTPPTLTRKRSKKS
jgi:hypothetical protein